MLLILNGEIMKREQWILINEISTSVINLNSFYCEGNEIDKEGSREDINNIAKGISERCTKMQLEDAISLLSLALKIKLS